MSRTPLQVGNGEDGGIFTFTGEYIHPLNPEIDRIHIDDIAYSLATQNRFTGHAYPPYSIGQHSIHVAELVDDEFKLEALLHDGGETYMSDIAKPVKRAEGMEQYRAIESRLDEAVAKRFGLSYPHSPEIKVADNLMLWAEMRDLMPMISPMG